jgi:hypothetical protein
MPAEKAIYRPDFVKLFFVHYATVTAKSQLGKPETEKSGGRYNRRYKVSSTRYADEETEGTMLHTKAIVEKQILYWNKTLIINSQNSKIGVNWPAGLEESQNPDKTVEMHDTKYVPNCYPVEKIDEYWVPKLSEALAKRGKPEY